MMADASVMNPPDQQFDGNNLIPRPLWCPWLTGIRRLAEFAAVLLCFTLGACSKSHAPPPAYQAATDPDPERGAENQLRQLLVQVNARETEVAAMARAAEHGVNSASSAAAGAERDKYYNRSQYLDSLRAAQSAITNKMTALAVERAILANTKDTNAFDPVEMSSTQTNRSAPDERTEEMKLKERLLQLQALNEDLLITAPPASQLNSQNEEKAEAAREDIYSPKEYVARLDLTMELLQRKLHGLDAEAAIYESLLNLNGSNTPDGRH